MFSYGSGLASSMFSLRVAGSVAPLIAALNLPERLAARTAVDPADFEKVYNMTRAQSGCVAMPIMNFFDPPRPSTR